MTRFPAVFLATLLLALCTLAQAATLTLSPGQGGRLGQREVTLLRVQDSRCPQGVACVHPGVLKVTVLVRQGRQTREVTLRLPPRPRAAWVGLRILEATPRTRPESPLRVVLSDQR